MVFKKGNTFRPQNTIQDVWKKIDIKYGDDWWRCWEWMGIKNKQGYGLFTIKHKQYLAHRITYKSIYGEIPDGLFVLHKCDNPSCCNPNHLWIGTHQDNMNDMVFKKRQRSLFGEKHRNAKLTNKDVLKIRELYSTGEYYQAELGRMFGVYKGEICDIVHNKIWKHLLKEE